MSKWEALSRLMGNGKQVWQTELTRIQKLHWWDKLKAVKGFPANPDVWHIHPIGLLGNFWQATCSCNKDITEAELDLLLPSDVKSKGLFYAAHDVSIHGFDKGKFLAVLNKYMRAADMMTCTRKVHFLSQMSHECDKLKTSEEYRNRDGSIPSGWNNYKGGSNFHGRGLIQLTHDENYIAYAKFVGDAAIGTDPDKVSHSIDHTANSACWYWRHGSHWGDINPKADRNDFYAITVSVNGGFNHIDDRFVILNKLAKLLGADKCTTNPELIFNDFQMEDSSLCGTAFYKNNRQRINAAVEAVNAAKSKILFRKGIFTPARNLHVCDIPFRQGRIDTWSFFNNQTYKGEYTISESRNADGMRVKPVTVTLKINGENNLPPYTYIADDLPAIKASSMGFLSIIANSGGMEGMRHIQLYRP